jgi:RimJ/RimL family protein N-acetyltransferase
MSLETPRLSLTPCIPAHVLTLVEDPAHFEQTAGFLATPGLREMFVSDEVSPEWLAALRVSTGPDPWRHGFFLIHRETGAAIGTAAFKGPPDTAGMVEIAYGVAPHFERNGFATEAASALVAFAFADARVELIRAHTLPSSIASQRVRAKCRFHHVADVVDPHDGPVSRWELPR